MAGTNAQVDRRVGARIRKLRRRVGLSQRELATDGVSYAYISRIESGDRKPSLSALVAIADRLREFAADWIAELEGDGPRESRQLDDLRDVEANTTALYLATGSHEAQCPVCGRHEQGGTNNGSRHEASSSRRK